jgi:hypothetical protein
VRVNGVRIPLHSVPWTSDPQIAFGWVCSESHSSLLGPFGLLVQHGS